MSNGPSILTNAPIGFGPGGPLPPPSPWTSFGSYIFYGNGGVVIGNPTGGSQGPGTLNASGLFVNGLTVNPNNFLQLSGGVITGNLAVDGNFTVTGITDGVVLDMGTF